MADATKYPQDEKHLELFRKRYKAACDARKDFDDKCDLIDKHYEPWRADWDDKQDRTPHVYHIVETMSANMVEPDPDLDLRPREPMDELSVKATRNYVSYNLERDGWPKKNARFVRGGNRYGLSTVKMLWDYREQVDYHQVAVEKPHPNPLMKLFGRTITSQEEVERVTVLADDFSVFNVDRRDFWWQPRALDIDTAEWCMQRSYVPLPVLERLEEEGVYRCVNMVKVGTGTEQRNQHEDAESEKDRRRVDEDGVEVIEMFDKVRNLHLVIANQSVVIADGEMPFEHGELPFACYVPIPSEDRFEGISPVEVLIGEQIRVWEMETDRARAVELALNPTLLVDKQLKDGNKFHIESGGRIFVNDPSQIKQLDIRAESALGFSEVQAYLGYMQQISGVSPYISGADPSGFGIDNTTATGVNTLAGAAGRRIGFSIGQLQMAIARIGRQSIQLMHEFIDSDRLVRVVGRNGVEFATLSPQDIPAMFDVSVKGSTESLNAQAERTQASEFVQTLAQFHRMPRADGRELDAGKAIDHWIETFELDPEEFWVQQTQSTEQQVMAEGQQAQAGAMQAMGEAQMAQPDMQMMMQQQQAAPSPNDLNGDGIDDLQRKVFESINFKDLPAEAQAAYLDRMGLPSQGVMQQDQLDQQAQLAKIRQMTSQAAGTRSGIDNA